MKCGLRMIHGKPRARGVALIEALVALLVMAFGMVAVAGLMTTMRRSADVAKQRGEALRIAQQQMETWRDYSVLSSPTSNQRDYTTNISTSLPNPKPTLGNATYTLTPLVTPMDGSASDAYRTVTMTITWADRAGVTQTVSTDSAIARVDPTLAGSLAIAPTYTATQRPPDGKSSLPPDARDLGGGKSVAFRQPSQPGSATVALVFNNISGVITSRCTVPAGTPTDQIHTSANLTSCEDTNAFALWGYVNFAGASPLTSANLASSIAATYALPLDMTMVAIPSATSAPAHECFDDGPADATDPRTSTQTTVSYLCVVTPVAVEVKTTTGPTGTTTVYNWAGGSYTKTAATPTATSAATTTTATTAWFGRLNVGDIIPASGTSTWQICRYSGDYDGNGVISNGEHPLDYRVVEGALGNQNFLVIKSTTTCPTGADGTTSGTFFSIATVAHQPNGIDTAAIAH